MKTKKIKVNVSLEMAQLIKMCFDEHMSKLEVGTEKKEFLFSENEYRQEKFSKLYSFENVTNTENFLNDFLHLVKE